MGDQNGSDSTVETTLFHRPSLGVDPELAGMPVDHVEAALKKIAHDLGDPSMATFIEQPPETI